MPSLPRSEELDTRIEEGVVSPLVDVLDKGNEYILTADLPGVEKGNISIDVKDDVVNIIAKKEFEEEEEKEGYIRRERSFTGFRRSIRLSEGVNIDKADATFKNGVLELILPKLKLGKEEKRIEIK